MKTAPTLKISKKPFLVTGRITEILKAIHFFRYMAAQDVCRLFYSPKSLTHVRDILSHLAGGQDYRTNQYLYRFPLPNSSIGNTEKIYTLGSEGRNFLTNELGLSGWYYRPHKLKYLSYGQTAHNLTLTRVLVAASAWAAKQTHFKLTKTRICYDLARIPTTVDITSDGKTERLKVVPDAWVCFEKLTDGDHQHQHYLPIILEVDKGSEHQVRFRNHVRSRIAFLQSGYRELFQAPGATIAYVTTGERPEYRETRRRTMCAWTNEVLKELKKEAWASIFRFCSLEPNHIYKANIFSEPVWYRPDSPSPVRLFTATETASPSAHAE